MTKVLSFAEWLAQQKPIEVLDAKEGCEHRGCMGSIDALCIRPFYFPKIEECPLQRAYEKQRTTDLQRWEKWNKMGDETRCRLPSEEVP